MVPLSGGETVYLKAGLGDFVSFVFSWLRAVVLGPTSCAFLAVVRETLKREDKIKIN